MGIEQLWFEVLERIQQRIQEASYDTWFKGTQAVEMKDQFLTIETRNEFQRDWLENQYSEQVKEVLYELTEEAMEVAFVVVETRVAIHSTTTTSFQPEHVSISDLLKKMEELELRVSELERK